MTVARWRRRAAPGRVKQLSGALVAVAVGLVTVSACTPAPPTTVSVDVLPTVQINGVAWSQTTVGNTVYVAGSFSSARPAGSRAGVNETHRANLLAYNITNGQLITSFTAGLNAAGMVTARSPDGTRLYVGGDFTSAGGQVHNRIVAISTATGGVIGSFAPSINGRVKAIAASNSIVYVGGSFNSVNGVARTRLAALNPSNGGLLGWKPTAVGGNVTSMVLTPDLTRVIIGGSFPYLNNYPVLGMGAVNSYTGANEGWLANKLIHNSGPNAGITSLRTDGSQIYGSGFVFGAGGNLEGSFAANPSTGAINWMEDCHGDTYDTYSQGSVMYAVSHAHDCSNIGGFPETTPESFYRATAFTNYATGTIKHNSGRATYHDWYGQKSPTLLTWFPTITTGTYTGQNQGAWSLSGNASYISVGGEFPTVNGVGQQGLVRFAVRSIAPNKVGPRPYPLLTPTATAGAGTIKLSWGATFDQDDLGLRYEIVRDAGTASQKTVYTLTVNSAQWNRPIHTYTDTVPAHSSHTYRVFVYDPYNNRNSGSTITATAG